jgi:hypothetical protein
MTHTQGPWRVTGNSIRSDNHIDGTGALLLAAGPMFHDYTPDPEEQSANLKLAAAAPAMLKALENLMGWFGNDRSTWDGWEGVDEVIDQAEAAIAKATTEEDTE